MGGVLAVALVACGASGVGSGVNAIEPRGGKSGLSLSGTIDGEQVVVNDGAPVLRNGDCDVNDGPDTDLCFFSKDLDGGYFAVIIENPDVVQPGTVEVFDAPCRSPNCDAVTEGLVAELQFEAGAPRTRVTGGRAVLADVREGELYSGRVNFTWPGGSLSGSVEVVPRPDESEG